jgi:putative sterol carrier protein
MFRPFSTEWADAFRAAINADTEYAAIAKSWTWPVALVLDATPAYGYPHPTAVQLTLDRGTCSSALIMPPHTVSATFVLRADYGTWKEVMVEGLDPIIAVTNGRIKFTGPLGTLMMHAKAASALVNAARAVPTNFPDETE